jgi:hypothetical protein
MDAVTALPWRMYGLDLPKHGPAPELGSGRLPDWSRAESKLKRGRPFEGIRIADFTARQLGRPAE